MSEIPQTESPPTPEEIPQDVTAALLEGKWFPLVLTARQPGMDLTEWLTPHRDRVERWVLRYGAVLFRGFAVSSAAQFERAAAASSSADFVEYREAATPRSHVAGNVFTSTEYPNKNRIYVHNENSHVTTWPLRLFFFCLTPAAQGGATPLADCRRIFRELPAEVREQFDRRKWLYVRTFGYGLGFSWQKVFNAETREDVERYCTENHMVPEWKEKGALVVRYRRWAALRHPRTGEDVWFNHGTFYNAATLEPAIKGTLLKTVGEAKLPYNTYFGDGERIPDAVMETLHAAYARNTVEFAWQKGDVLAIDNMLVAHGRRPFEGKREVFVTMTEKMRCVDLARPEDYLSRRADP